MKNINSGGFTLLETVIALGVILGGIIGPYTLATRGVVSSSSAKQKLIAFNLAQEGIELVRHMRENNVIADEAWDEGIGEGCGGGPWQIGVVKEDGSLGELECDRDLPLYYYESLSLYNQSSQLFGVLGAPTPFKRKIEIKHPIPASDPEYTPGINPTQQMLVRSIVEWQHRSITQRVVLDEIMFNWE